jgi:hypothetical protein
VQVSRRRYCYNKDQRSKSKLPYRMSFLTWCLSLHSSKSKNHAYETSNLLISFMGGAVISSIFWGCLYNFASWKTVGRSDISDSREEEDEAINYKKEFSSPTETLLNLTSSGRNVMQSIIRSSEKVIRRTRWPWDRKRNQSNTHSWEDPYGTSTNLSMQGLEQDKVPSYSHQIQLTMNDKKTKKKRRGKESYIDIGNIFGLDVGGTLVKLVYFEKRDEPEHFTICGLLSNSIIRWYR